MNEETFPFDGEAYLHRIGVAQPLDASVEALAQLHRGQAYAIPFENFDILLGRGVDLEPAALFDKMVRRRRGGYCFELNGLFLMALRHFGFDARPTLACVHLHGASSRPTHQIALVTINGNDWIADVGFGANGPRLPIPLEPGFVSEQDGQSLRLVERPPYGTMVQVKEEDRWQDLYSFDSSFVERTDIEIGNHYTATHPDSIFTFTRIATLPSATGRVSLMDFSFKDESAGETHQRQLQPGDDYLTTLEERFGIELDAGYDDLPPVPT